MKWKIIRNEDNEIIRYELTKDIYITRDLDTRLFGNYYTNSLIVNGNCLISTGTGSGYTLKDLKLKGESILNKKEI